jgi:bis(5'-nucleosyl)-tetraphosphatase (symmetrical)
MATYAIGDIQGCFDSLQRLLHAIRFDPTRDRLWLVGDLVNRGPRSLQVLRWARDMDTCVTAVLGNHDLYLLKRAAGVTPRRKRDTIDKILNAYDRSSLIDWLRHRPLGHVDGDFAMFHAGLHPAWTVDQARILADEVAAVLRADDWHLRIAALAGDDPPDWSESLDADERLHAIASVLTRIRACSPDGRPCLDFAGSPRDVPEGHMPWFAVPHARWREHQILFGHWAALGLHRDDHCVGLDTGCVWGGLLTAMRLEDRAIIQVPAAEVWV